jgi:hypothetical protein
LRSITTFINNCMLKCISRQQFKVFLHGLFFGRRGVVNTKLSWERLFHNHHANKLMACILYFVGQVWTLFLHHAWNSNMSTNFIFYWWKFVKRKTKNWGIENQVIFEIFNHQKWGENKVTTFLYLVFSV